MNRREFIRHLEKYQCLLVREGGKHTVYLNTKNNKTTSVPRHTEVNNFLCKKICKDLEIPSPV